MIFVMNRDIAKRYSLAEVVLLGLFVAGLIGAAALVSVRGRILLSKPVSLDGSGLSAPLPADKDWRSIPGWQYEQNRSFLLLSGLMYHGRSRGDVIWRYHLAPEPMELKRRLELCAIGAGGRLADCQELEGSVRMVWGWVTSGSSDTPAAIIGYSELDSGRLLELQVRMPDQPWYAQDLFEALGKAVVYEKSPAVQQGAAMVEHLSSLAAEELFGPYQGQSNFQVRDSAGMARGYIHENLKLEEEQEGQRFRLETKSSVNLPGFGQSEDVLTGANPYKAFQWSSKSRGLGSVWGVQTKLTYKVDGLLAAEEADGETAGYRPGPGALSELLIDSAARQLLDGAGGPVWLNIIGGSGKLLPALAQRIDAEQAGARAPQIKSAIQVKFIDGSGLVEEIYFDNAGNVIGGLLMRGGRAALLWERVEEDLMEQKQDEKSVDGPVARAALRRR